MPGTSVPDFTSTCWYGRRAVQLRPGIKKRQFGVEAQCLILCTFTSCIYHREFNLFSGLSSPAAFRCGQFLAFLGSHREVYLLTRSSYLLSNAVGDIKSVHKVKRLAIVWGSHPKILAKTKKRLISRSRTEQPARWGVLWSTIVSDFVLLFRSDIISYFMW